MPAKAGRKAKPLSQNLDELEQKLIDLANAQREEDDVKGEEKESLLTKEGKAEQKKKIKEITNKKGVLTRAINDIRGRLKRQTKEEKNQAIIKQVNDRLDQINQNPKVDIQITKTRLQKLKQFLGIGQQTEQKEQDPVQSPPSGRRSPGRMSPSGTPEAPVSQASSMVPSGMTTPEEEEEPIQYASVGDFVLRKGRRAKTQQKQQEAEEKRREQKYNVVDNVNKAEEQGSNTEPIPPDYLLREISRVEIVESKYNIPPPNQRREVNELLNSEVETVPDVININQNQTGINESTSRQREQDTISEQNRGIYEQRRRDLDERIEQMKDEFDRPLLIDLEPYRQVKSNLSNPSYSSSSPDNIYYKDNKDDKINKIMDVAESVQMDTDSLFSDIESLSNDELDNVYNDLFPGETPSQEEQLGQRIRTLKGRSSGRGMMSGSEESQLGQRLAQIAGGAQAGAIAGARQGIGRGVGQAIRSGAEGGLRGGIASGIAGQLGGGLIGQLGNEAIQRGITDILGRLTGGNGPYGPDEPDEPDDEDNIKRQIDNINQELGQIKDPLSHPVLITNKI
jgi:hypothetical protein